MKWLLVFFVYGAHAAPTTVASVDLNRYVGDWYQISHIPLFFEFGNCDCARQRLTPGANGVVDLYNTCTDKGALKSIRGEAYNDDPNGNAKFLVDFHLGFKGTYWIVGLDPAYRFAVVTDAWSYSLYILSRTPVLGADLYAEALAMANQQNLNTGKLVMTAQNACTYPP